MRVVLFCNSTSSSSSSSSSSSFVLGLFLHMRWDATITEEEEEEEEGRSLLLLCPLLCATKMPFSPAPPSYSLSPHELSRVFERGKVIVGLLKKRQSIKWSDFLLIKCLVSLWLLSFLPNLGLYPFLFSPPLFFLSFSLSRVCGSPCHA